MKNKEHAAVLIGLINEQILVLENIVEELYDTQNNDKTLLIPKGFLCTKT